MFSCTFNFFIKDSVYVFLCKSPLGILSAINIDIPYNGLSLSFLNFFLKVRLYLTVNI